MATSLLYDKLLACKHQKLYKIFRLSKLLTSSHIIHHDLYQSYASYKRNKHLERKPKVDFDFPNKKFITEHLQEEKGKIYDKKPFKHLCQKDKKYFWCACGWSKTQPFCDGTHKDPHAQCKTTMKPVPFVAPETKEYWFCNCKQTKHRPFCDGTHKLPEIQEAIRS